MGTLVHRATGARHVLSVRDLVGRSRHCDLRLASRAASGEHGLVAWVGGRWALRDLGSRNGSWVGERRVEPGAYAPLGVGDALRFGEDDDGWTLEEAGAPTAMARATDGSAEVVAEEGLLPLPSADTSEVTVYLDAAATWQVETRGATEPAVDRAVVSAGGRTWMLRVPDAVGSTAGSGGGGARPPSLSLRFKVSRDEEHVELAVRVGEREVDLGARAHHQALLQLARARLADGAVAGLPETSRGWVYQDDLVRMLAIDEGRLNVDIYRARKQLAKAGVPCAAGIVERRADTRQLRIGTELIEETRL